MNQLKVDGARLEGEGGGGGRRATLIVEVKLALGNHCKLPRSSNCAFEYSANVNTTISVSILATRNYSSFTVHS